MKSIISILPRLAIVEVLTVGCSSTGNWEYAPGTEPVVRKDPHDKFIGDWFYAESDCRVGWEQGLDDLKKSCGSENLSNFIDDVLDDVELLLNPQGYFSCWFDDTPVRDDTYAFTEIECGVDR